MTWPSVSDDELRAVAAAHANEFKHAIAEIEAALMSEPMNIKDRRRLLRTEIYIYTQLIADYKIMHRSTDDIERARKILLQELYCDL